MLILNAIPFGKWIANEQSMFFGLSQDFRFALRGFIKSPLFSLVAVLSIGLGIGANAAIFSLLDQVLLRPLPVAHPERTYLLDLPGGRIGATFNDFAFSHVAYRKLRQGNAAFDHLVALFSSDANLSYRGRSETVPVAIVSGNFFAANGLSAAHGRLLTDEDDRRRNAHPVIVLSYGFFERRFGGDPAIVGQTVRLNAQPYQVVGVAPRGFAGLELENVPYLYVPLSQKTQITTTWDGMDDPNFYFLHVYGVLKPGLDPRQAKANLDSLLPPILEDEVKNFPALGERGRRGILAKRFQLLPAGTPLLSDREVLSQSFYLLFAIVALVLLIACANVANLLMARASSRVREIAVRMALGAGQGRIARQMLVESLLIGLSGGVLGLILSIWILDGIMSFQAGTPTTEIFLSSKPDLRVGLFCFVASILTSLLFGIAPAMRSKAFAIVETLKENTTALMGHGAQGWLRRALVVGQVTISLVLLVAAGLLAKSLFHLKTGNTGFRTDSLLTFRIDPSLNGYDAVRAAALLEQFESQLTGLPGVKSVALAAQPLLSYSISQATMSIEGVPRREGLNTNSRLNEVNAGFFHNLGYPLLQGREFTPADRANSRKVAIVNEVFANEFFRGQALGKRIGFGFNRDGSQRLDYEIVGVVRDGKFENMRESTPRRFVYRPYTQLDSLQSFTFYLRTGQDPGALTSEIRATLRRIDENMAMDRVQTMDAVIDRSLQLERMMSVLSTSFGLLATVLAAIGLYGVMAYSVSKRTREIGIRLALGAERSTVIGLVLREVATLLLLGLLAGLPLALGAGWLLRSQLWNLKPTDPVVLAGATLLLALVALVAGVLPAWRASRVSPMNALRYE